MFDTISFKTCGERVVASPPSIVRRIKSGLHSRAAYRTISGTHCNSRVPSQPTKAMRFDPSLLG